MKIAAARIARFNPLTIELDLEIKADLGIITVDKFLVKIPLDGTSSPMILPSGVKVNIPGDADRTAARSTSIRAASRAPSTSRSSP